MTMAVRPALAARRPMGHAIGCGVGRSAPPKRGNPRTGPITQTYSTPGEGGRGRGPSVPHLHRLRAAAAATSIDVPQRFGRCSGIGFSAQLVRVIRLGRSPGRRRQRKGRRCRSPAWRWPRSPAARSRSARCCGGRRNRRSAVWAWVSAALGVFCALSVAVGLAFGRVFARDRLPARRARGPELRVGRQPPRTRPQRRDAPTSTPVDSRSRVVGSSADVPSSSSNRRR